MSKNVFFHNVPGKNALFTIEKCWVFVGDCLPLFVIKPNALQIETPDLVLMVIHGLCEQNVSLSITSVSVYSTNLRKTKHISHFLP